VTRLQIRKV